LKREAISDTSHFLILSL